jgi:hypothetical protein
MALWLSWYVTLAWDTAAQRETFYLLFASVGLVLLYMGPTFGPRAGAWATFAGAFLVTTLLFGKPTAIAYVAVGALTVWLARESPETRRQRLKMALWGAGAGVAMFALLLAAFGSFRWYFFWCVVMPYRQNAYLFRIDWRWLFLTANPVARTEAFVPIVAGVAAIVARLIPLRALGLVFLPAMLFTGACLQARGLVYQFTPATAAVLVLLLVAITEVGRAPCIAARYRPIFAGLGITYACLQCFDQIHKSPYLRRENDPSGPAPANREPFAPQERAIGRWLKERTQPNDRVFLYHGNAHVALLEAGRLTASPFFHTLWLDPVSLLGMSVVKPDAPHLAALEEMAKETRARACEEVQKNDPAAVGSTEMNFVFDMCPPLKQRLASSYDRSEFGGYTVYLKRDSAGGGAR